MRGRALGASVLALVAWACLAPLGQVYADPPPGSFQEFPILVDSPLSLLREIASGPEGEIWFVTEVGSESTAVIGRMSSSGQVTSEFVVPTGNQPNLPERYSSPEDIAVAPDGNLWFSDVHSDSEGRSLIGRVTPTGRIDEFPLPAAPPGQYDFPGGIAAGPDDHMWFTEPGLHSIGRISLDGKDIEQFSISIPAPPPELEHYEYPEDIVAGPEGNMWFTDTDGLGRITPAGKVSELPLQYPDAPYRIALGTDGNIWFTTVGTREGIGRVTPSGEFSEFPIPKGEAVRFDPPGNEAWNGIVLGPDGNIWFSDTSGDAIDRITPSGVITAFTPSSAGNYAPSSLAVSVDGDIWFTDSGRLEGNRTVFQLGRFITPFAPTNADPPRLSGKAVEGQALSVSQGSWAHDPDTLTFQWQSCDSLGVACSDLGGEIGASYILTASDVGHRLRAVLTASNVGGVTSAVSASSAVVLPLPPPAQPSQAARKRQKLVGATITWKFRSSRRYTKVKALVLHNLPTRASVEIGCHGRGCAFSHKRLAASSSGRRCDASKCGHGSPPSGGPHLVLTHNFDNQRLSVGTRIFVRVTSAGLIGKMFTFTMRPGQPPVVIVSCVTGTSSSSQGGSC